MLFGGLYSAAERAGVLLVNPQWTGGPITPTHPCVCRIKGLLFPHRFGSELPPGEAVAVPRSTSVLPRPLAEVWGTPGWDVLVQTLLDGGFCVSGSWAGGTPGQAALASRLAEPCCGSLITGGSRRRGTVQGWLCVESCSGSVGMACIVPAGHRRVANFILH